MHCRIARHPALLGNVKLDRLPDKAQFGGTGTNRVRRAGIDAHGGDTQRIAVQRCVALAGLVQRRQQPVNRLWQQLTLCAPLIRGQMQWHRIRASLRQCQQDADVVQIPGRHTGHCLDGKRQAQGDAAQALKPSVQCASPLHSTRSPVVTLRIRSAWQPNRHLRTELRSDTYLWHRDAPHPCRRHCRRVRRSTGRSGTGGGSDRRFVQASGGPRVGKAEKCSGK